MSYLDRYVSLPLNNKSKFTEFINEVLCDYYGTRFTDGEVFIYGSTKLVGPNIISEAIKIKEESNCKQMLVITNSHFTSEASALARDNWIMLMDEAILLDVINQLDQGKRHGSTIKENIVQTGNCFNEIRTSKIDKVLVDKLLDEIAQSNLELELVNKSSHEMLEVLSKELAKMQAFELSNKGNYGSKYLSDTEPENQLFFKLAERTKHYDGLLSDREDARKFIRRIIERCNVNQMLYEEIIEDLDKVHEVEISDEQLLRYNQLKTQFLTILNVQIDEMNRGIDYMYQVKEVNEKLVKLINDFKENDQQNNHSIRQRRIKVLLSILLLLVVWFSAHLLFGPVIASGIAIIYLFFKY